MKCRSDRDDRRYSGEKHMASESSWRNATSGGQRGRDDLSSCASWNARVRAIIEIIDAVGGKSRSEALRKVFFAGVLLLNLFAHFTRFVFWITIPKSILLASAFALAMAFFSSPVKITRKYRIQFFEGY